MNLEEFKAAALKYKDSDRPGRRADDGRVSSGGHPVTAIQWRPMMRVEELYKPRIVAALLIFALQAVDLILTYTAIHYGAVEGNPLAVWLIESRWAIPLKLYIGLFCVFVADRYRKHTTVVTLCAAWAVFGVYMLVAALNSATLIHYINA